MLPRDTYTQPQAADPVLEEHIVLAMARHHGQQCTAVTHLDETGGEARVYVLDDHIVLKTQRPHRLRTRTSLAKEAFFLQQLTASPDIVVPQVLGYGSHASSEYLVMTRMPGVPAITVELAGARRTALLQQLGSTLRRLHALPQAPFYASTLLPGNRTREEFVARLQENLQPALQVMAASPQQWPLAITPEDLARKALAALPASLDLVALHSNPGPEHVFVHPESHAFVGIIDFGDAYIGHPAQDWRWPTHADRLALLHGYGADAPLRDDFMAAWQAILILSDLVALAATRPETRPLILERLRDLHTTLT